MSANRPQQDFKENGVSYLIGQKPRCAFRYDEKLETLAANILQKELTSEGAEFYDPKRPLVTLCHSKATLMFSGLREPQGRSLLDPPHIFVEMDTCSHRILKVGRDDGTTVTNDPLCG